MINTEYSPPFLFNAPPSVSAQGDTIISISNFLHFSKDYYQQILANQESHKSIHFVMGNESADLDSTISSIALAYLLNYQQGTNKEEFYIPLINITKEEMSLRKDILYLFQLTSISIDHLLFLDDQVPLETLYNQRRLRLNLVDHHLLKPSQAQFSSVIERVIDHHLEENVNYPNLRNENKTLCKTGSNITLIAEKLFENLKMTISPEFALLLLGPILIDTSCLNSVEKTTERDIKIAHDLTTLASAVIPNDFYEKIFAAKIDISGLTPSMLLIRDYKEYRDNKILYGISSLSPLVDWTLDDLRLIREDIEKYAFDRHLTYLIILMSSNEPQAHRKVFIYSRSINLLRAFEAYLKTDPVLKDLLAFIFFSQELQLSHYIALRPLSRKDLQPLLHFSEISKIQF